MVVFFGGIFSSSQSEAAVNILQARRKRKSEWEVRELEVSVRLKKKQRIDEKMIKTEEAGRERICQLGF